jgi:outer membrane protein assembly factor BamB
MAFGHVAWHRREEPMMNTLLALDAFNGMPLWRKPLKPGIMVDRSTMVATASALYLADDASCAVLDAATGASRGEITVPRELAGGTFWKWMALEGGVLYALVGEEEPPDADARWRSTGHGWPWNGISKGYNRKEYAWGFARTLFAIDPVSKKVLWHRSEDALIDSRALCMSAGRIFVSNFGKYVSCVDAKTGGELWRRAGEKDADLFEAMGPYRPGHGYIEGWKTTAYAKCTDKALYLAGPQTSWLSALSAEDGRLLWRRPVKNLHVIVRDEGVFVIGPERTTGQTRRLDPLTGEDLQGYDISRRACTRSTGSADGLFFRAYDGTTRLDVSTGKAQWISPMRPSCQVGVVVAHGHLYWIPWVCDCNLQMFGAIALGPAGEFRFDAPVAEADRLDAAGGAAPAEFRVDPADWPAYRADNARSGRSAAAVPGKVRLLWTFDPGRKAEASAPVAAGGRVFVGHADGVVRSLDAATGEVRWTAYTGGAVRFPPAVAAGRAFVGSGDGWAYAFEASSGRLLWRFRGAPEERRIPVYGALLSTWPVSSGVLAEGDAAYFAAGINCMDGTHVYALEAASGKLRWHNGTSGHLDGESRTGVAAQGELLLHEGKLYLAGGNAASPGVYDLKDGACFTPAPAGVASRGRRGRELSAGPGGISVTGQPFYSTPDAAVFDKPAQWAPAEVAARNARLAFLERKEGEESSWAIAARAQDGKAALWERPLPAEPQRWGIALDAAGRVVVALRDGRILCFGE